MSKKRSMVDTRRIYGNGVRVIDGAYTYTVGDGSIARISLDQTTHEIAKYLGRGMQQNYAHRQLQKFEGERMSGGDPIMKKERVGVRYVNRHVDSISKGNSDSRANPDLFPVLTRPKPGGCGCKEEQPATQGRPAKLEGVKRSAFVDMPMTKGIAEMLFGELE